MAISSAQRRLLRQQAHHLKPVVTLGQQGLTAAVLHELNIALDHHELLKVKINGADRTARAALISAIAEQCTAEVVQHIGHTASFYRANPNPLSTDG